jgi:glycosyltransferase involved in cell wall biosynthesis
MPDQKLDIVLPCYNPIANWAQNIIQSLAALEKLLPGTLLHVYLVNDGAQHGITDQDIKLLQDTLPQFTYISYPENRGKGYALRQGVSQTTGEYCIYTDIDFPYTEQSLVHVFNALRKEKADIAVGVRDENYYSNVPPARVKISKTLRFFARKLLLLPVSDTQAGLKGFNQKGKAIFLETEIDRYLFDLEFLFEAARNPELKIHPVKVALKPGIVFSKMNSKILMTEGYSFARLFLSRPFSRIQKKK